MARQTGVLKKLVEERFNIVGGRIRQVFSSGKLLDKLKKDLRDSVRKLDFDELASVDEIDLSGNAPSLCYTILPKCCINDIDDEDDDFVIPPTQSNASSDDTKNHLKGILTILDKCKTLL